MSANEQLNVFLSPKSVAVIGATERLRIFLEINKETVRGYTKLEKDFDIPVLIGSIYAPGESQVTHDLNEEDIRIYDRLDEIARILSRMHRYYSRRSSQ